MPAQLSQHPRPAVRSARRRRHGNAIIELALTLGILLNLSFGMVEFGYYFYIKDSFEGAAREGARASIVPGATTSSVTTAIANAMSAAGVPAANYSVEYQAGSSGTYAVGGSTYATTASTATGATTGQQVGVTVYGTWGGTNGIGVGFSPMHFIGASKVLKGVAVMRHE